METRIESPYKYDVFISYHHDDKANAKRIFENLTKYGLNVFWSPKTLDQGVPFPKPLEEALLSSQHLALCWSNKTKESRWVSKEAEIFETQCHLKDPLHRRMYVSLDPSCSPEELPASYQNLNRPKPENFVLEIVKNVLHDSRHQCEVAISGQSARIQSLQEELEKERKKVKEAQNYYRYNRFWGPVTKGRKVHIFTCARDFAYDDKSTRGHGGRTNIDLWDYRSVLDITKFLAANYPQVKVAIEDPISKLHGEDLDKATRLADRMSHMRAMLENKNCIIIGSPDVNDFAEIVLAEIHRIDPYTEGRHKKKGFVVIKERKGTRSSFYWQKNEKDQEGVLQIQGPENYEYFPHDAGSEDGKPGAMYGILIVANNPFCKKDEHRKIIILSGYSGVATNAIAKLLTDDEKCLDEFFKLDNAYIDSTRNIEALICVKYDIDKGFSKRDTRNIANNDGAITFKTLVEI
jgi:hypothetical protein